MTTSLAKMRRAKAPPVPAAEPLRLGPLADFIGFHLRLAQEASFQAFARRVRGLDLRPGRFAVLALIGENPGISQTALGRASGRDKSSLTPALDDLAGRALIHRRRVARDRRSYALSLTPKGERLLATLLTHAPMIAASTPSSACATRRSSSAPCAASPWRWCERRPGHVLPHCDVLQ
jgi:DNA-binding MarR family transcriptional regulator